MEESDTWASSTRETPNGSKNPKTKEGGPTIVSSAESSGFRLAFALALVKSKPPALTLRGHVLQLRRYIKQGRRVDLSTSRHHHVDSLEYWKEQCNSLKIEGTSSKRKIYELEQKNNHLKEQGRSLLENVDHSRKKPKKCVTTSMESPVATDVGSSMPTLEPIEIVLSPFAPIADVVPLLNNLRQLHLLINSNSPDISLLSTILKDGCFAVGQTLSSVCTNFQTTNLNPRQTPHAKHHKSSIREMTNRQTEKLFSTIARTINYLVRGLDVLATSEISVLHGQVIYYFVKLFADTMDWISCLSPTQATSAQADERSSKPALGRSGVQETDVRTAEFVIRPPEDIRLQLCHLLLSMIVGIVPTYNTHLEILEGFLCALLTRVGQRLSILTFGPEPSNLTQGGATPIWAGPHPTLQQAGSERGQDWYLIWLLERALPKLYDSSPACAISGSDGGVLDQRGAEALVRDLKARIQSTLLEGVFGGETEEFQNRFKKPNPYTDSLSGAEGALGTESDTQNGGPEWFTRALWRLIGWQVLAGEDLL